MIVHNNIKQGSKQWHALRAGLPTGSNFKRLVTGTGVASTGLNGYAIQLAKEKMSGLDADGFGGNKYTERGHAIEAEARMTYEFTKSVKVDQVGFISDDLVTHGVSPDGLVSDDGSIEIKGLTAEEFISAALYYVDTGRCEPGYVPQTQGIMMVAERKWCDWIAYHPDYPIIIIRQYPDPQIQSLLIEQLENVIIQRNLIIKTIKSL